MGKISRFGIVALFLGVLSGAIGAQTLGVPASLTSGTEVTITVSNPARAGEDVTVTVTNGAYPSPVVVELTIHLDAQGNGSKQWRVPLWNWAKFNMAGVLEEVRLVDATGPL